MCINWNDLNIHSHTHTHHPISTHKTPPTRSSRIVTPFWRMETLFTAVFHQSAVMRQGLPHCPLILQSVPIDIASTIRARFVRVLRRCDTPLALSPLMTSSALRSLSDLAAASSRLFFLSTTSLGGCSDSSARISTFRAPPSVLVSPALCGALSSWERPRPKPPRELARGAVPRPAVGSRSRLSELCFDFESG